MKYIMTFIAAISLWTPVLAEAQSQAGILRIYVLGIKNRIPGCISRGL